MNSTYFSGLVGTGIVLAAAVTTVGCGSSSDAGAGGASGHAGSSSAGQSAGGSGGSGVGGGAGGTLASGGSSASAGTGGAELPVPRVDNTDGVSVLDSPQGPAIGTGACDASAVACNGMCLSAEGQKQGTCTALKLGLGQTTSMALTTQALFYTAANREILEYDLTSKKHTSLVRGLEFVQGLAADDTSLYFSTEVPDSFFQYDVRSVPLGGGDETVIAPSSHDPASEILPLSDKLLFGTGNFAPYDLYTVPKTGGPKTAYAVPTGYELLLDGTTLYYLTGDFGAELSSTSVTAPAPGNKLNSDSTNSRFVLDGGFIYRIDGLHYRRAPAAGGAAADVQLFTVDTYVLGRTPTQILLGQDDATAKLTHILTMPFAGGTPAELVTVEYQELKAIAANATDLYLSVGISHAGGLLDVSLLP